MTRILSSIFYISSMRKTSSEFSCDTIVENIWALCGEDPTTSELPYWETINRYLARLDPEGLQDIICQLCRRLLRSRAFENARIRGKHWQVLIDGTQLHSSQRELDGKCLYRVHNKGTAAEYRENYYYALEAKLVLHPGIVVSVMTEFVENADGSETEKQDCERKACWRILNRLKKTFPHLKICVCADSLYACERFFKECGEKGWRYILRFKEGSVPTVADEYSKLKDLEKNRREMTLEDGVAWYDYAQGVDYNGHKLNVAEYGEDRARVYKKGKKKGQRENLKKRFLFLTDLPVNGKNVSVLIERGRMRWKIENEGFNTQKRQGYSLEHQYSKNYQAQKCHYLLIQIGHMIAQVWEAWGKLWESVRLSREQKHRRLLESFKTDRLKECGKELEKRFQLRLR